MSGARDCSILLGSECAECGASGADAPYLEEIEGALAQYPATVDGEPPAFCLGCVHKVERRLEAEVAKVLRDLPPALVSRAIRALEAAKAGERHGAPSEASGQRANPGRSRAAAPHE